jgi:hypothetical protein
MVDLGLKEWLNREDVPSDFYQLLGRPRLCRNREQLVASLEDASEYLFQFQNHKEKVVRDRARVLHRQVAEARRTITDESRWDQYDLDLIARLYRQFLSNPDFTGPNPKLDNLRRWLALVQNVEPARIEELIADWTAERSQPNPVAKPQREMETQTHAVHAETEILAKVPSDRERRSTVSAGNSISPRTNDDSGAYRLADDSLDDLEIEAGKPTAPPPPPVRSISTERDLKGPPPPPPKTLESPQTPAAGVILPAAQKPSRSSESRGNNMTALWIVMAAFLTALVLGMFVLMIAWASGAFDRQRSDLKPTVPPAYVDGTRTRTHFIVDRQTEPQPGRLKSPGFRFGFHRDAAKESTAEHRT